MRNLIKILLGSTLMASQAMAMVETFRANFDAEKVGTIPAGWDAGSLDAKGKPVWAVAAEKDAPSKGNVMRQSGNAVFNFLVAPHLKIKDGLVTVTFRIESGKEDPEAGLVLRFTDAKNYLYVRANSLEKNLVFYRMNGGKKELVKSIDAPVAANAWQTLQAEFHGDAFKIRLDGKEFMTFKDNVSNGEGRVGLWTTADTVAAFDNFEATP